MDDTHFYVSFDRDRPRRRAGRRGGQRGRPLLQLNGTWSMFFDGSAHGLSNRTSTWTRSRWSATRSTSPPSATPPPPGISTAGNAADDADIYSVEPDQLRLLQGVGRDLSTASPPLRRQRRWSTCRVDPTHFYPSSFSNAHHDSAQPGDRPGRRRRLLQRRRPVRLTTTAPPRALTAPTAPTRRGCLRCPVNAPPG